MLYDIEEQEFYFGVMQQLCMFEQQMAKKRARCRQAVPSYTPPTLNLLTNKNPATTSTTSLLHAKP
jgi:hypothetical protein